MLAHNDCASTMALGSLRAPSAILSGGGAQVRPMCDPLGGPAGLRRWRPKKVGRYRLRQITTFLVTNETLVTVRV